MEAGRTRARKVPVRKAVGHGRSTVSRRGTERRARRQFLQFMVCGAAFVLLVAAKLWSPRHAAELRQTLSGAIEKNMDIQAVFSTIGRTFAGEKDPENGLREVWRAVFLPDGAAGTPEWDAAQNLSTPDAAPLSDSDTAQGVTDSESAQILGSVGTPDAAQVAENLGASDSTQAVSGNASGVPETLTPHQWEGSFSNSTAFASLSEPWPEISESLTVSAESVTETPSDGNAFDDTHPDGQSSVLFAGRALPENVGMQQALLNFDYQRPVKGTLTSGFGYRNHPVDGVERFHYGVDIAAEAGTEILCFADGVVTATGESTSFGKYCTVEHSGGFTTLYAHCSRVTASSGAAVRKGDKIAEVGATGQATGPHLHFALQREGVYLNPIYYVTE